jgi:hypothetical protein
MMGLFVVESAIGLFTSLEQPPLDPKNSYAPSKETLSCSNLSSLVITVS